MDHKERAALFELVLIVLLGINSEKKMYVIVWYLGVSIYHRVHFKYEI